MYYNPSSLPYNPTAPLRNTVPYIPIEMNDSGVHVSSIIHPDYVNYSLRSYIEGVNTSRTAEEVEEIQFIKEQLAFKDITRNLMMLGSVLEDDAISLSSDEEVDVPKSGSDSDEYIPHYPPRTLKEIYSLPHKNRGDLREGLAVTEEELKKVTELIELNELPQEELNALLEERDTRDMNQVSIPEEVHGRLSSCNILAGWARQMI